MFPSFTPPIIHLHEGLVIWQYAFAAFPFTFSDDLIFVSLWQVLSSTILVFIFFTLFRSVSLSFSARSSQHPSTQAPREFVLICHVTNMQSPLDCGPGHMHISPLCWGHMYISPFVMLLNAHAPCDGDGSSVCLGHVQLHDRRKAAGLLQGRAAGRLPWVSEWFVWLTACFLTNSGGLSGTKMTGWVICSGTPGAGYPCFNYLMLKP